MIWFTLSHIFSAILELIHIGRLSHKNKDLDTRLLLTEIAPAIK